MLQGMQPDSLTNFFWKKLKRFWKSCLDLGKIKTKFGQNQDEIWAKSRRNLGKIKTKFGQNQDEI